MFYFCGKCGNRGKAKCVSQDTTSFSRHTWKLLHIYLEKRANLLNFAALKAIYMSNFCVYIKLKPFVKQWLVNALGNPVRFPSQSIENSTIHSFVIKLPKNAQPDVPGEDLTAICVPDSASKPAEYYNYLTPRGKMAVAECCEHLFRRCMWNELGDMSDLGCNMMSGIYAWCEKHGIDIDYADTIRQRYYRIREQYAKHGIDLMKKTKNRNK